MNKQERRHFAIDTLKESWDSYPDYFRLYKAFLDLEEFSQEGLIEACKGEPFLAHLSPRCNYLKEKILQSLLRHQVTKEQEPAREIRNILNEVRILFDRKLFFFCRKKLAKGKKLAQKFGLPEYLLEILAWDRRILRLQMVPGNHQDLAQTRKEENLALKQLKISTELVQMWDEALFPSGEKATDDPFKLIDQIPKEPGLLTFRSKRALNELKAEKAKREQNSQLALEMKKENYLLWKDHPEWLQRHPKRFFAACSSYLEELKNLEKHDLFREVMDEASSNKDLPRSRKSEIVLLLGNLEFVYHLNLKIAPDILNATRTFEEKVNQAMNTIGPNKRQHYLFNLGLGYYIGGEKSQAKNQFQEILNSPSAERLPLFQDWSFLWRQVILFETNAESFEYFNSLALNYFRRRDESPPVAEAFLRCLSKNMKTNSARERIKNYRAFISEYQPGYRDEEDQESEEQTNEPKLEDSPEKRELMAKYELFLKWVQSKITFKDFLDLV